MGKRSRNRQKKPKFSETWTNQGSVGKEYGMSAIAVGKVLIKADLKDPETKQATAFALSHGFARSTPLADGRPHFMWNRKKVQQLLDLDHQRLDKVDYWVNEMEAVRKQVENSDDLAIQKFGWMMVEETFKKIPAEVQADARAQLSWY